MTDSAKSILAIDSSSSFLRLAVRFGDDRMVKSSEEVERSHGQMILRKISTLMESAGATPASLAGIIVCTGPGSFTGLRVGIAVAKGIAVAREIPVAGVSLFDVAASRLSSADGPTKILVLQRRGEYLAATMTSGRYDRDQVKTLTIAEILATVVGSRFATIGPVESGLTEQIGTMLHTVEYDASDLILIGESRLSTGGDNIDSLEPLYFGKSQAEIKFDQRHTNA
jgi:tRNA threonylcarbamoyl adenosine modification protein YeaZ